jgi:AcrR family transcriptional regulator
MTPRFTTSVDEKQKILDFCSEKFITEGFYKTTVDEISQEIHISKNTIYKFFPTKEKLVWAAIENIISKITAKINIVLDSDDEALEKLVKMLGILSSNIIRFTDKWIHDMQIHAPALWEKVDKIRQEIMYRNISKIIRQGQKEKVFKDYPAELIITIFVSSLRGVVSPQFLLNASFTNREALRYTLEILLNGILTEKGTSVFKTIKLPI